MPKLIFECYEIFTPRSHSIWCVVSVGEENNCEFHDPHAHRLHIFGGGGGKTYKILERTGQQWIFWTILT